MDKLSHHLHIRITHDEQLQLQRLLRDVQGDCSSVVRLAIKRLFRKPPTRRFRHRTKRGARP